jgi:predicted GIY-YIG superfamily endonuclease
VSESKDEVEGIRTQGHSARLSWFVYILLCRNGGYYVGVTNDLARRWQEHLTARGGHYTGCNRPVKLLYSELFPSRAAAEARERQLKGWTRAKKEALITGDLNLLKLL